VPTYTVNFPYVSPEAAKGGLAAIINRSGAGAVEIRRIRLSPSSGQNPNNTSSQQASLILLGGKCNLARISAVVGGSPLAFGKHDTSVSNQPSQIQALAFPKSVTEVEDILQRGDCPSPTFSGTGGAPANSRTILASGASRRSSLNCSDTFFSSFLGTVQGLVLREGEGVAFMQRVFSWPHAKKLRVVFRDTSGPPGHTYFFTSPDVGSPPILSMPIWALFNGVGSGRILELVRVELAPDGAADTNQLCTAHETNGALVNFAGNTCRLMYLDDVDGGDLIAPSAHDSNNGPPPGVFCYGGPMTAYPQGYYAGIPYDELYNPGATWLNVVQPTPGQAWPAMIPQRQIALLRTDIFGPSPREANLPMQALGDDHVLYDARGGPGIMLPPGLGIGLVSASKDYPDMGNVFNLFDVEITFNYKATPSPANVVTVLT
jgi:hypothetical protein